MLTARTQPGRRVG